MSDEKTPQAAAAPTAPTVQAAAIPTPPEATEERITLTRDQLNDRIARARTSYLKKDLGVESEAELQARLKELNDLRAAEEERKRAALSVQERLEADLRTEREARSKAEAAAEQARVDLHLTRLFAKNGIRNADYATWRIMERLAQLPESEELDEAAYLSELMTDPRERIALGLDDLPTAPAPTRVEVPATTTTAVRAPAPPPANGVPGPKSAFELDAQAWAARKAQLGI